jgi:methionyl-tRNA synthetase
LLTQAVMPTASEKILDQLAIPAERRTLDFYPSEQGGLAAGTMFPKPAGVFPRYVEISQATETDTALPISPVKQPG